MSSPYNLLPSSVKALHQIIYSELINDDITIVKTSAEKWGAMIKTKRWGLFSTYTFVVKPNYNSVGYNAALRLIEAVVYENNTWNLETNASSFFDVKGKCVWEARKGTSVRLDKFGRIWVKENGKMGLFNHNFQFVIPSVHEGMWSITAEYFVAFNNGQYRVYDASNIVLISFEAKRLFNEVHKGKFIVEKAEGGFALVDVPSRKLTDIPFSHLLRATSNTYAAPTSESLNFFKSIVNSTEDDDEYHDICKYKGKWGIAAADGSVVIPNQYDYIDFLRNPKYFKVAIGEILSGEFEDALGENRRTISNLKWGIIDNKNNIIVPIEYDWIKEVESTLWAVYQGGQVYYNDEYQEDYWTIEGGKLGVYNMQKLVVPIAYDTIMLTWFRVKNYIFVQNNTRYFNGDEAPYDVYTFSGQRIEVNKPDPRDHYNGS
jgi:WG containing repeat